MEEDDFSKLSLQERWTHSKWKARQSAYQEATNLISQGETPVSVEEMRLCASDSNVVALESGIAVVAAYFESQKDPKPSQTVLSVRRECIKPISEKGLTAVKKTVKDKAVSAVLLAVEVADPQGVVDDILEVAKTAKSPKHVAAYLTTLKDIYSTFGSPVCDFRAVLQMLVPMFAHTDRNVRQSASELAVALCRWTGQANMVKALQGLKPVQLNELVPKFEAIDYNSKPTKLTRAQQAAEDAAAEAAGGGAGGAGANAGFANGGAGANGANYAEGDTSMDNAFDPWDIETPVDVLAKIPGDFYTMIESKKWKERFEALESYSNVLKKTQRIAPNNDALSVLAPSLIQIAHKDMNISCSTTAIVALTALANGLRTQFSAYASRTLEAVVERFKDKKKTTVDAIGECIDTIFNHVIGHNFQPILDTVLDYGMNHRTPTVKLESTNYMGHLLCETPVNLKPSDLQRLLPVAIKLLGDTSTPLRDAAAKILAALTKLVGSAKIDPALRGLDEHKRKRVTDWLEKVTVKAKQVAPQPAQGGGNAGPRAGAGAAGAGAGAPPRRPPPGVAPNARPAGGAVRPGAPPAGAARPAPPGARPVGVPGARPVHAPGAPGASRFAAPGARPGAGAVPQHNPLATPNPVRRPPQPTQYANEFDTDEMLPDDDTDLSADIASPGPRQPIERPSFNSTPRMVKRSIYSAGITPGRGYETYRRRMDSPLKSPTGNGHLPASREEGQIIEDLRLEVAKLSAEAKSEKVVRLEAEKKLAEAQVVKEREISKLKEEIHALQLRLKLKNEEFDRLVSASEDSQWGSSEGVSERLTSLSIEGDSRPSSRARPATAGLNPFNGNNANRRSVPPSSQRANSPSRPHNDTPTDPSRRRPIRPISTYRTPPNSELSKEREEREAEFKRAVEMTQKLKQRVEELKRSRAPSPF